MRKSIFLMTLAALLILAFASCTPRYGCPGAIHGKTFRR